MNYLMCNSFLVVLLALPLIGAEPTSIVGTVNLKGDPRLDLSSIEERGPQANRWSTRPDSRLVLNPQSTGLDRPNGSLPLDVGWWGHYPERLGALMMVGVPEQGLASPVATTWTASAGQFPKAWTIKDMQATFRSDKVELRPDRIGSFLMLDLGQIGINKNSGENLCISMEIDAGDAPWSLSICDTNRKPVPLRETDRLVLLNPGTHRSSLVLRVPYAALADGHPGFLRLIAHQKNTPIQLRSLSLSSEGHPWQPLREISHTWNPAWVSSSFVAGDNVITIKDAVIDEYTVIRQVSIPAPTHDGELVLSGIFPLGDTPAIVNDCVINSVGHPNLSLRITALEGIDQIIKPFTGSLRCTQNFWRTTLSLKAGTPLSVACVIATSTNQEGISTAHLRMAHWADGASMQAALNLNAEAWKKKLRSLPAPQRWGIPLVESRGVTPERHRQRYYAAWAFILGNVLPTMPEVGLNHEQFPAGKPSLWAWGSERTPGSCAWESFFAQQFMAFVDPAMASRAYLGMIAEIDTKGMLGGESLPSRKAQTAWILYKRSNDLQLLETAYPALQRYMGWREQNPRWLWNTRDYPAEKDLEFVASWLFDVTFMIRIAEELHHPEVAADWRKRRTAMIEKMEAWFFNNPQQVEQYWFEDIKKNSGYDRTDHRLIYITSALGVDDLPESLNHRLMHDFSAVFSPNAPLAGFDRLKFPDEEFTAFGLFRQNSPLAVPFVASTLRDVLIAKEFCEEVEFKDGRITSGGVLLSVFTAAKTISFSWMLNGLRVEQGIPQPINSR